MFPTSGIRENAIRLEPDRYAIHVFFAELQSRRGCPRPVFAFGFDPARWLGAPKLLSEGGQARA
jgi:hypothetical protein